MLSFLDYNATSTKARLIKAALFGFTSAILLGLLYGFIYSSLKINVEFSYLYIVIGLLLGNIVKRFGKGFTRGFRIIAGISAIIFILVSDSTNIILSLNYYNFNIFIRHLLTTYSVTNVFNILNILFRIMTITVAYSAAVEVHGV